MNGWFLTLIIMDVLNIGMHLAKHGEPRENNYNFFGALIGTLINLGIIYGNKGRVLMLFILGVFVGITIMCILQVGRDD